MYNTDNKKNKKKNTKLDNTFSISILSTHAHAHTVTHIMYNICII